MSKDNYSVAGRYRTVRQHLDDLGYKQAISLDSLPLLELLLVDLAHTKESLKHFQSIAKDNLEACSELQLAIDPYKCDNAKLVQECNKLHLELIETKEANQKEINEYKKRMRKLESELTDLQLSFSKNLQRIKQLEVESSNKSKKISELQGKCCKPIVNNVSLANRKRPCYPLRRPVLEAESLPRTTSSSTSSFSTRNVEPYIADFVSTADHRISCLSNEVTKLKEELFLSNEIIESLKSKLNNKEKEMSRLRKMLEGGRPCASINKDHCCIRSDKVRNSTDNDTHCLQQAKLNLEQQLKEALDKQHDAMAQAMKLAERNEQLEMELKNVDRLALAVEADCNSTVKENNRRVCRLQEKLEDVMTQVHILESELTVQRREAQELRADLEACRLEKCSVQRALETTLEEKKQMTDKINNLTIRESNLNDEVERLKKEIEKLKNNIRELEQINKDLENKIQNKEKSNKNIQTQTALKYNAKTNHCALKSKEEAAVIYNAKKKLMKSTIGASATKTSKSSSQDKRSESKQNSPKECACKCKSGDDNAPSQSSRDRLIHEKNVIIESLQNTIERLETDRDHYKSEYVKLKDQMEDNSGKNNESLWSKVCELRAQMSEKEHAIAKLLREKQELCQEKFNLENKLQLNQQANTATCNFCYCHSNSLEERQNSKLSQKMEKLQRERDTAKGDVERLKEERDALREKLKVATEHHVSEQRRLRESLCEAESRLSQVESERRDLLIAQEGRRAALSNFDEQLDELREELSRTRQELTEQRTQYFQLRTLQDQTDQALCDVQGQLTQCENELTGALDRNKNLERQQLQLDNQIKELRQDINTHRSRMTQLDREKDQLLMDLDERTEKIAALERELDFKEQQLSSLHQQIRDLSHNKEICMDQAADMDRQLRSVQLEMEQLQRQLSSASLDRESAIQENRRLQDDLAQMSCEVRNLHKDLEAARAESHDLKRQLQTYVSEVRRAEELLSQKENERTEMLNHFRSLSLEASVLENNNHSLESEAAEARASLESARDQITDLERRLTDKDCLVRGYEAQITELTQSVASLELQLQQALDERCRAEDDLRTVRDLCMTLEQQKDYLSKRLEENIDLKNQYEIQISRHKSEQDVFQDQMNKDHMRLDRLEKLLEESRRETIDAQTTNREYEGEITRLKQKICDLQNKLSSESAELRRYQTQAAEYSKQVSELRRQVTNERFDRARKKEDSQSNRVIVCVNDEPQCKKETGCQTENSELKVCQCQSNQPPITRNITGWNRQSDRCGTKCAFISSSSDFEDTSGRYKFRITEVRPTEVEVAKKSSCPTNDHQSSPSRLHHEKMCLPVKNSKPSRVCLCSSKIRLGELMAQSKSKKISECEHVEVQSDKVVLYPKTSPSKCSISCLQKHKYGESFLITNTLQTMLNILENKRNDIESMRLEHVVPKQNYDSPQNFQEEPKDYEERIDEDHISKCSTTNINDATQTPDGDITISDNARPQLLKILGEIQYYAKNIEEQFQELNETVQRDQFYKSRSMDNIDAELPGDEQPAADLTLPTERLEDFSQIDLQPQTSTPKRNSTLDQPDLPSISENEFEESSEQLSLPPPPELSIKESSELDVTEYKDLPQPRVSIERPRAESTRLPERITHQIDSVVGDVTLIQQKIDRLRRELFDDYWEEDGPYEQDKNGERSRD